MRECYNASMLQCFNDIMFELMLGRRDKSLWGDAINRVCTII